MTVRNKHAMTSSTGREADDSLGSGQSCAKSAKVSPWVCCEGGDMTVVASTDIPAHATAGPYPGGLDFAARTSDHQATEAVIKVRWREGRLVGDGSDDMLFSSYLHQHPKLQLVREKSLRWMLALQPARDRHEQNVEVLVEGGHLVLHVLKAVPRGERLLLWYGDSLARAFGVPFLTPAHIRGNQQYTCTTCHASFQFPNTLKAHILFKCDGAMSRTLSPSLTSPSAFTTTVPLSSLRYLGSGPSAFHRSAPSAKSPTTSSASFSPRERESSFMTLTRRRDVEHSALRAEATRKAESSSRPAVADRRTMTPDSSTDDTPALNLSTRKTMCSSSVPSLSVPVCSSVQHNSSANPALSGSLPAAGQPIQIFNHIHPPGLPALPIPLDQHMALRLYYPWLASVPDPNPTKILCTAPTAMIDPRQHLTFHSQNRGFMFPNFFSPQTDSQSLLMTSITKPSGRGGMVPTDPLAVPQEAMSGPTSHNISGSINRNSSSSSAKPCASLLPVPSDKEGEPLDLMPPSFVADKSRKGHLCLYCGKLYSRKYGLKIHLRTHTGYKPLKCKVCLRPFGDPSNLNKHVRLHAEGDTPYRCDYCGKVLVRRRDLERHIRSRHPTMSVTKEEDDVSTECIDSDVDVTSDAESNVGGEEPEIEVT